MSQFMAYMAEHGKRYIMELNDRLELLCNGGQISGKIKESIINVIKLFDNKLNIKLTEENGAVFITHLAIAAERMMRNKKINPMDDNLYREVRENPNYHRSVDVLEDIEKETGMEFPENEKAFIILHICSIL
jgi:PRD domain.